MKTGTVKAGQIAASKGLRLDAVHYLEPTRHVDADIARSEKTIKQGRERLKRLKAQRAAILKEKG